MGPGGEVAPRTALGVTPDGRLLIFQADGIERSQPPQGLTLYQTAQWLSLLGAFHAVNLDGGGSSTTVYQVICVAEREEIEKEKEETGAVVVALPSPWLFLTLLRRVSTGSDCQLPDMYRPAPREMRAFRDHGHLHHALNDTYSLRE